jgi:hypothetical protein
MIVGPKKPRPDCYDFTYDMFVTSISGEESEISCFSRPDPRCHGARARGRF